MTKIKLTNVSNPAAFGVEWIGESGTVHQLVNSRGTTGLMYGRKTQHSDGWVQARVVDPERFGLTSPPRSMAEFRAIAERFVFAEDDDGEGDDDDIG